MFLSRQSGLDAGESENQGDAHDNSSADKPLKNSRLWGMDTVDKVCGQRTNYYDTVYRVKTPCTNEEIIVNIEIQSAIKPGYSLALRASYYVSRLVSAQGNGLDLKDSEYDSLKKVYSIWLCPIPSQKYEGFEFSIRDSIRFDGVKEEELTEEKKEEWADLVADSNKRHELCVRVFVYLGEAGLKSDRPIIRLLSNLLSIDENTLEERKRVLEEDFGIPMTVEIDKEMEAMCNYGSAIWQKAKQEGIEEGIDQGVKQGAEQSIVSCIRHLMQTHGWGVRRAMDELPCGGFDSDRLAALATAAAF